METLSQTNHHQIFQRVYASLSNGIRNFRAEAPKKWLSQKGITAEKTGACFNSGQMHHRKPQGLIDELLGIGFLKQSAAPTNTDKSGYTSFGNYAILFPLKDGEDSIVNFFAIGLKNGKEQFLNDQGIYPCYPKLNTRKLYIVKHILDGATLLEAGVLDNKEAVMVIPTEELLPQHKEAIQRLTQLEEVIWIEQKHQ